MDPSMLEHDYNLFEKLQIGLKKNLMRLAPVIVPGIGMKKGKVSKQTLEMMHRKLLGHSDSKSKWVPSGSKKQTKVFHSQGADITSQAPSKMS